MARLVIFGTGDIARLAHFYFSRDSEHEVAAFAVDDEHCHGDVFLDHQLAEFLGRATDRLGAIRDQALHPSINIDDLDPAFALVLECVPSELGRRVSLSPPAVAERVQRRARVRCRLR